MGVNKLPDIGKADGSVSGGGRTRRGAVLEDRIGSSTETGTEPDGFGKRKGGMTYVRTQA